MTFSKIADSKVNVTIFKYNYNTYQLTVGNTMALLHEDEVRELIEYLDKKLDE